MRAWLGMGICVGHEQSDSRLYRRVFQRHSLTSRRFWLLVFVLLLFGAKQREQDDIADGARIGEQHGEPVDTDTFTSRRWQTIGESTDVVVVHGVGFFIATRLLRKLL